MRFDRLVSKAVDAAREEGRRATRPEVDELRARGLRRTAARATLGALTSVALIIVVAALLGPGSGVVPPVASTSTFPDTTTTTVLVSPFPTYVENGITWNRGECPGADSALRGGADGLPKLGQTDEARVREVATESGLDLEKEFGALYYRVVPRGGQVWERKDDGSVEVVEVADYQIELVLPDASGCPSTPYSWNGIPIVFTITDTVTTSTSTTSLPQIESDAVPVDIGPLEPRGGHSVIWTGEEVIVWGGEGNESGSVLYSDGAAYDPITDTWRLIAPSPLSPRRYHVAVWTGEEMLVVGGVHETDAAAYEPTTDTWRSVAGSPIRLGPGVGGPIEGVTGAVWTGSELVIWQVSTDEVAAYDPAADEWTLLPPTGLEAGNGALRTDGVDVYAFGGSAGPWDNPLRPARLEGEQWVQLPSVDLSTDNVTLGAVPTLTAWDGEKFVAWSDSGNEGKTVALAPNTPEWAEIGPIPVHGCEGLGEPIAGAGGIVAFGWCDNSLAIHSSATGTWTQSTVPGYPTARYTVWTGSELINWGDTCCYGTGGAPFNVDAWRYRPPD